MKTKNITYPGKLTCKYCNKEFSHLGSHIWHKHKVTAKQYKEEFGLPYAMALISEEVYQKKVDKYNLHREKYLANIMQDNGHRFEKGKTGHRRISEHERKLVIERVLEINKSLSPEKCPICNMVFDHLPSHLYNKHKMIKVCS